MITGSVLYGIFLSIHLYGVKNSLLVTKSIDVSWNRFYIKFFPKSDKSFWGAECLNTTLLTNTFAAVLTVWSGMGIASAYRLS